MKKRFLPLTLVILAACNFGRQQPTATSTNPVADTTPVLAADTAADFPEIAAIPSGDDFPGTLAHIGTVHPDEFSKADSVATWFAFYKTDSNYYYKPIQLQVTRVPDPVLEDEEGWEIAADATKDTVISIVYGVPDLKEGNIAAVKLKKTSLQPGDSLTFRYNGADFKLYATGHVSGKPDDISIHHYRLFLVGMKDGARITQLLVQHTYLDDNIPEILLAGDLDGDAFPDLLINTTYHYNLYRPTLFLSSGRGKNELLHVVAMNDFVGC
ncbi:hypothetical protein [Chitinophaga sp. Cy-1792]|uniref:hypothetical protein n=1 Tax=Chitinophaga sp. Cy-1792 TaxID=2608339 RepID=UPI00141E5C50|nr:hypothetical protein [Chitinophaga sp. Cy-1792]NIG56487.1 hypothetical protein [Chitinophaga sp. Cy-1792]